MVCARGWFVVMCGGGGGGGVGVGGGSSGVGDAAVVMVCSRAPKTAVASVK